MTFEEAINQLNQHFFFQEFTFSKTTFRPNPTGELELADSIIWLGDTLIAFQLKERGLLPSSTAETEARWFKKKILTEGTRQIRDTLAYLSTYDGILVENHRGHQLSLSKTTVLAVHKIVCYLPRPELPAELRMKKFHDSATAGIIHIAAANDYLGLVHYLMTPPELAEYLAFRADLAKKYGGKLDAVPEPALLGQYISGDFDAAPDRRYERYVAALQSDVEAWDMSGVIKRFPDRITTKNEPTDYYAIVAEIAKLKRNELREFKLRFQLSMEKARANKFAQPYRMSSPRTGCGFLFVPLESEFLQARRQGLMNLTAACKYDLKLDKCIGMSIAPDGDEWYSVEWVYMEFSWEHDPEMERRLHENNPFREVKVKDLGRYTTR